MTIQKTRHDKVDGYYRLSIREAEIALSGGKMNAHQKRLGKSLIQ